MFYQIAVLINGNGTGPYLDAKAFLSHCRASEPYTKVSSTIKVKSNLVAAPQGVQFEMVPVFHTNILGDRCSSIQKYDVVKAYVDFGTHRRDFSQDERLLVEPLDNFLHAKRINRSWEIHSNATILYHLAR